MGAQPTGRRRKPLHRKPARATRGAGPLTGRAVSRGGHRPAGPPPPGQWPPLVVYPLTAPSSRAHTASAELARLVGPTRADLLTALARPASTSELAARHFLSPATVSYHLGVLRRSGLVSPIRDGRYVLYRRTEQGTRAARTTVACGAVTERRSPSDADGP
ncbi:winged helix-turn-helix domain-containing protein [Streptomyces sp. NBC_01481]|nr:winged helix-turn-helix domain-containing protein [Streptomyces sp. NBC_01481]